MNRILPAVVLSLAAFASFAADERPQDRWKLEDIYPDDAAFNADAAKLESQLEGIGRCKGKLGTSAKRLKECFDLVYDATKRYYRIAVYANEREAEETGDPARQQLNQKSQVVGNKP